MTLRNNIMAILESYFGNCKDELIESATDRILAQVQRKPPEAFEINGIKFIPQIKDEPTISKMEQVDEDINVRSKWETPPKFEHKGDITTCVSVPACLLEIEDEPQTDCAWK